MNQSQDHSPVRHWRPPFGSSSVAGHLSSVPLHHNGLPLVLSRRPSCPIAPKPASPFAWSFFSCQNDAISSLVRCPICREAFDFSSNQRKFPVLCFPELDLPSSSMPRSDGGPQSVFPVALCWIFDSAGGLLLALLYLAPLPWKALNNNLWNE